MPTRLATRAMKAGPGLGLILFLAGCGSITSIPTGGNHPAPRISPLVSGSPNSATPSASLPPPTPPPTTSTWRLISDPAGHYSFRIPRSWVSNGPCVNAGQVQGDQVMNEIRVGPPNLPGPSGGTNGLGGCGSDFENGIAVDSYPGTKAAPIPNFTCNPLVTTKVTVNQVRGTRSVFNNAGCSDVASGVGYDFVTHGRVYNIFFQRNTGDPDLTQVLDTLMTQTWAFRA